jgi:hypothetical protein
VSPVQAVIFLFILLGMAYAAGYLTRELISRHRRAHARKWRGYIGPEWLEPANTNVASAQTAPPDEAAALADVAKVELGQLGRMLDRWESRARARRSAS